MSQLAMGCVTCHACHGCVTDFRPILGNPVEVTHVTSPGHVYVSHTKGLAGYFTSFFFYRPSLLLNTTFSTSFVSLGPTGAWPLPCTAAFPHSIGFLQLLYYLLQHGPCTPIPGAPGTS